MRHNSFVQSVLLLVLIGGAPLSPAAAAEKLAAANDPCPLESAVDFQTEAWVATREVRNGNATLQAAQDELFAVYSALPHSCRDEIDSAQLVQRIDCQKINRTHLDKLMDAANEANSRYDATADKQALTAAVRGIMRNFLTSVPHDCWFQKAANGPPPSQSPVSPQPRSAQCQQLWNNYWACKSRAEEESKRCSSSPTRSCTIPYCLYPPNVGCY